MQMYIVQNGKENESRFWFSLWEITSTLWEKAIAGLLQGKILTDFSKKRDVLRQEVGP